MKNATITKVAFLCVLGVVPTTAKASTVDIVQAPTGFFTPDDASSLNSPYYRGFGQGWGWQHNPIAPGFSSATLQISAFDVDFSLGEQDMISVFNGTSWVNLGLLSGSDNTWAYTNFNLDPGLFPLINNGLDVRIDIDQGDGGWEVSLAKSVLTTDGAIAPPAEPVSSVPLPAALPLFGCGMALLGMFGRSGRRKKGIVPLG